jgi:hypothetical protein
MAKTNGSEYTNDEASYGVSDYVCALYSSTLLLVFVCPLASSTHQLIGALMSTRDKTDALTSTRHKAFSAQLSSPAPKHQICHAHQLRDLQYVCPFDNNSESYFPPFLKGVGGLSSPTPEAGLCSQGSPTPKAYGSNGQEIRH